MEENLDYYIKKFTDIGIGVRNFFLPMHNQPVFKKKKMFEGEKYPVAEYLRRYGFYLPSGIGISDNEIHSVIKEVNNIFK